MKIEKPKLHKKNRIAEWQRARAKLIPIYLDKRIMSCEVRLENCLKWAFTGFAHRHKRNWYYDKPGLLGEFNQTILACQNCHQKMESDEKLTETIFNKLRDNVQFVEKK